ncbi:MAG: hypothetical protein A3J28_05655 [Acidobacteria bacterium RIFCSPLOWO2_12_FULL_60_22]|nr:MAG: hypothetical protein A3J28_05655 [Acidobacteria bacterium RIFCSPLOWO2_12_FULL_60_22]
MCHQTVGLIQGLLEDSGIATVSLSVLAEVTRKVKPPRALLVPFPLGYPLGKPRDSGLQRKVILQALTLLTRTDLPVLETLA